MRSSKPPRRSVTALSFGTSSSIWISLFCRKTWPWGLTDSVSGSRSWSRLLALVCGRSIGTPTVSSGADTMKMMSSTSMTSTIGVTLIWLMTSRRRWRRLPTGTAAAPFPAIAPSPPLVDLPRQDRGELVGESLEPLRLLVHLGDELVIENGRRDGGNKADCGRKQRFRDARRHHRQGGIFRGGDRLEAGHDPPHRPEQAHERAGRTDRRQHQEPPLQPLDLAGDGHVHHLLDAHLQAGERAHVA